MSCDCPTRSMKPLAEGHCSTWWTPDKTARAYIRDKHGAMREVTDLCFEAMPGEHGWALLYTTEEGGKRLCGDDHIKSWRFDGFVRVEVTA